MAEITMSQILYRRLERHKLPGAVWLKTGRDNGDGSVTVPVDDDVKREWDRIGGEEAFAQLLNQKERGE